jgi:3-polyprenyl-4-hydroxybenzoate decarboxylase
MDDARSTTLPNDQVSYEGLRDWLEKVEGLGELLKIDGADWDAEMGSITQMMTEKSRGNAPALLFDNVPGYPEGYRTLALP